MAPLKFRRRTFFKSIAGIGWYPVIRVGTFSTKKCYFLEHCLSDISPYAIVKEERDLLIEMANEIKSLNDSILNAVAAREIFSKRIFSGTKRLKEQYFNAGPFSSIKNTICDYSVLVCSRDFDVDIVPTTKFLQEQVNSSIGQFVSSSSTSDFEIVPVPHSTEIQYSDPPFNNLVRIRMEVSFKGNQNLGQNKYLFVSCIPRYDKDGIQFSLFSQPIFKEKDNGDSDPIGVLPVGDRLKYRTTLTDQISGLMNNLSAKLPNTSNQEIPIAINPKRLVVVNGIRILSNSNPVPIANVLSQNPFSKPEFAAHNFNINISEKYSQQILSKVINSNFKLDVPPDFRVSIMVKKFSELSATKAQFEIFIYGIYSYDWFFDTAEVILRLNSQYSIESRRLGDQINFTARLITYSGNVEASGFPPIGAPESPDEAADETRREVENSMENNRVVQFSIPANDSYIYFNGNSITVSGDRSG